jgi:hypothetical protein
MAWFIAAFVFVASFSVGVAVGTFLATTEDDALYD